MSCVPKLIVTIFSDDEDYEAPAPVKVVDDRWAGEDVETVKVV